VESSEKKLIKTMLSDQKFDIVLNCNPFAGEIKVNFYRAHSSKDKSPASAITGSALFSSETHPLMANVSVLAEAELCIKKNCVLR
jgi:hypothetical protein